jgi:hypothetical protein
MDIDRLIDMYPRLFHMANAGSWSSIRRHGLLSTSQIVSSSRLSSEAASRILEERRSSSVPIHHPVLGEVAIRDQGPLNLRFLEAKLTDVTLQEWLGILNDRVFFWLHPDKLEELLNARRYRNLEQDVLTIDTRSLMDTYESQVRLSPINSGAALYPNASPRGTGTFLPVADYDYESRRRGRNEKTAIVELAVIGGVGDIRQHVVRVERRRGSATIGVLPLD